MQQAQPRSARAVLILALPAILAGLTSCALFSRPTPTTPPSPINFAQVLDYAQRSALVYESNDVIRQKTQPGATVTISSPTPTGVKAYVETDDANRVQWVVVRGTSNLANVKLDVDYNKVVDPRLQVPLHKGF